MALTLRLLGGLTVAEVAHAFLVPETTMAQRITRAKAKIRAAGIPYRVPDADRPARRASPACWRCSTWSSTRATSPPARTPTGPRRPHRRGDPARAGCCASCCPTTPEVAGLLALMLLTEARRTARVSAAASW